MIGLNPLAAKAVPSYIAISTWTGFIVVTFYGLLTVYPALRLIQKVEAYRKSSPSWANMGSPSWGTHSDNSDHDMIIRMETMDKDATPENTLANTLASPAQAGLSVSNSNHSNQSSSSIHSLEVKPDRKVTRRATKSLTKPLHRFLNDEANFTIFAGYLSECFALENLLFLERAIVLHHLIVAAMEKDKSTESEDIP